VKRLLDNILKTLTATSILGLSSSVLVGLVGAVVMYVGARQILAGSMTLGQYFSYTAFLGFLVAPMFQIVAIGTQLTEALAGLERTREILSQSQEDKDPHRVTSLKSVTGDLVFDDVSFAYNPGRMVLNNVSFHAAPGTVTALVGSSGSGKSTIIGLIAAFHTPVSGRILIDGVDLANVRLDSYRTQLGVVLQESFLFDGTIRENVVRFSRRTRPGGRSTGSLAHRRMRGRNMRVAIEEMRHCRSGKALRRTRHDAYFLKGFAHLDPRAPMREGFQSI